MLKRAQCEKTVLWPMNIMGLNVAAMSTVQLDSSRYGLSNYAWTVSNWALSADYGAVLSLREENEEIYDDGTPRNAGNAADSGSAYRAGFDDGRSHGDDREQLHHRA
jgi:hypothetical protein